MSQAFFQLTPWVVGYIGTVFTREAYAVAAVFSFIWFTPVWIAQNRNAPDNTQMSVHLFTIISLILGIAVGAVFNWGFRYPRLVDMRMFREPHDVLVRTNFNLPEGMHPRTFAPETTFLLFDVLMMVIGYYYVRGNYEPGVTDTASKAGGWILIGLGIAFFIATYLWMWFSHTLDPFNKRQDSKYIWPMAALLCIHASYDQWSPEKWNGIVLLGFIMLVWTLNYFYIGYAGFRSDVPNSRWFYFGSGYLGDLKADQRRIDRFSGHREALTFVILVGLTHLLTSTGFYIVDGSRAGSILSVMIVLSAISAVWMVGFFAWGLWNRHSHPPTKGYIDDVWILLWPTVSGEYVKTGMSWPEAIIMRAFDSKYTSHAKPLDKGNEPEEAKPLGDKLPRRPLQDRGARSNYSSRGSGIVVDQMI